MAIRAVDLAMPVQRSAEMTQNQRGESRPEMQAQQFAARFNKEAMRAEQTVQQLPQSEGAQIQKDGRGNSGGQDSRSKKKGSKKEKASASTKRASDSMFDISV